MARFNKPTKTQQAAQPVIRTAATPTLRTGNNAPGFARDTLSELFVLGVSNFYGQDTFYEKGAKRDQRYLDLIHAAAQIDADWLGRFLKWLRTDANMRTASIVGAVEAVRAMIKIGIPGGRSVVDSVLQRADEPGEMLAYWLNNYGQRIPKPIKRGIADAAARLYTERNTVKYDTAGKGLRFGSVLELCHAAPAHPYQGELFGYLVTVARGRSNVVIPDGLVTLVANEALRKQAQADPRVLLNPTRLDRAAMTWENVLALGGDKLPKKDMWQALIPNMGYMALLRNLRNFDQAGISKDHVTHVMARLQDPAEVANSRQLPMRFQSAYNAVVSDAWKGPLARALDLSLQSIPQLPGRTLVLVDTSGSMNSAFSKDGTVRFWDAAVLFGLSLAARQRELGHQVDVVSYSTSWKTFGERKGETVLQGVKRWKDTGFFYGGGTETAAAVRANYSNHDRVVVITDEQANWHPWNDIGASVPADRMLITFNVAGYKAAHAAATPFRITIAGLSDQAFALIPALERGAKQEWPF